MQDMGGNSGETFELGAGQPLLSMRLLGPLLLLPRQMAPLQSGGVGVVALSLNP